MRITHFLFPAATILLIFLSGCGKKSAEQQREDSIRMADSIARVEALLEEARLDSIRRDSIRQDSIARAEQIEKTFPKMKMLISGDMISFGMSIKDASSLAKTFAANGYEKKNNNTYIFDPAGPHEATIQVITRKIDNWRYEEFPEEENSPYIYLTDVVLTFSNEEDAIKFVNSSPRKLEQVTRNKNVVRVEDRMGD